MTSGYFKLSNEWKDDEVNYWKNFKDTAYCALPLTAFLLILFLLNADDLNPALKSSIAIFGIGVVTYVLSIFHGRYKHARYLRAHYEHLTIATTFYRNFIQDTSIAKDPSKQIARENLLNIAKIMPMESANKESITDKLIPG